MRAASAIEVWWAPIDAYAPAQVDAWAEQLDLATRAAAGRLVRTEDRARTVVAHTLARRLVSGRTGAAPQELTLTRRCAACGETDHGKPLFVGGEVPAPAISISHAGAFAVVAIGDAGCELGVDVELPRKTAWEQLRRHTFTDAEWRASGAAGDPDAARLLLWSAKEAVAKATGHGLELGLHRIQLDPTALRPGGPWATASIAPGRPRRPGAGAGPRAGAEPGPGAGAEPGAGAGPGAGAEPRAGAGLGAGTGAAGTLPTSAAVAALSPGAVRAAGAALVVAQLGAPPPELPAVHEATALLSNASGG